MKRLATIFVSLLLSVAPHLVDAIPRTRELPLCTQAWRPLIQHNQHHYDYSSDARHTPRGNEGYASYQARVNRRTCKKPWTVLVYMAADNDLTPYAYWDLYEMEAGFRSKNIYGGSTLRGDLIVQLDTEGNRGLRRLHIFQTPEPYNDSFNKSVFDRWNEENIRSPIVSLMPESSEPEASKLEAFLAWGMQEYPAEHYMVIVWGHGQGWASEPKISAPVRSRYLSPSETDLGIHRPELTSSELFSDRKFGGLAFNQTRGTFLSIPALRTTLQRTSQRVLNGHPIDIYASDACLMQMFEVATEIAPVARFIVGSTQVQNFLGLPYRRLMYELNTGRFGRPQTDRGSVKIRTEDEPFLMARMIPQVFRASMAPGGLQGRMAPDAIQTVTMSAISGSEIHYTLLPALENFSRNMLAYLKEDPIRAIDVQFVLQNAPSFQGGAQDVGAFLTLMEHLLLNEAEKIGRPSPAALRLKESIVQTKAALHRSVISYALGTRYTSLEEQFYLMGIKAASLWLPSSPEDFQTRIRDFQSSLFYKEIPNWPKWLSAVFQLSKI
jgi:hypothetical protein